MDQDGKGNKNESLGLSSKGKRRETEPLYQSGKGDKSDKEKTSRNRKIKKITARSPTPETNKRAKESRTHRNKSRRYSSPSDSTTSSSDTPSSKRGESQDEILAKTERFHVVANDNINKYDLPAKLAEHAN